MSERQRGHAGVIEICSICGKKTRVHPKVHEYKVSWKHEYTTIPLVCGHESCNTYDDGYTYTVTVVEED